MSNHKTGLIAERLAEAMLRIKGYGILAKRFKTPSGEIDIIARRGDLVAFVEVKTRKTAVAAAEAIHAKNRKRVAEAAALYLQRHPQYANLDLRFDAVIIAGGKLPEHIEGAWEL